MFAILFTALSLIRPQVAPALAAPQPRVNEIDWTNASGIYGSTINDDCLGDYCDVTLYCWRYHESFRVSGHHGGDLFAPQVGKRLDEVEGALR